MKNSSANCVFTKYKTGFANKYLKILEFQKIFEKYLLCTFILLFFTVLIFKILYILLHKHNKRKKTAIAKIDTTTEVLIILKGILRVDFYNTKEKYLFSKKLYANDLIMLSSGGHGFKVLKDVEMIEVKQGPYFISKDKVKFDKTNESQSKSMKKKQ